MLDMVEVEVQEEFEGRTGIEREGVISIPKIGIELCVVENKGGGANVYLRREGETEPKYRVYPEQEVLA